MKLIRTTQSRSSQCHSQPTSELRSNERANRIR